MADDFTFKHSATQSGSVGFNIRTASFGDGYSQASANGINNRADSWDINVIGVRNPECSNITDIDDVIEFLDGKAGWQSFLWTPPTGKQGRYTCTGYSVNKQAGVFSLIATFQEVFR